MPYRRRVALSTQLDVNMPNMASVITDSSVSTSTDSDLKRTLPPTMQGSVREGSPQKRPKKETKLDILKAQQKEEATILKQKIKLELELVKDKGVTEESVLEYYCDCCDTILAGREIDQCDITILKEPFAKNFVEEDLLREKLSPRMLLRSTRSTSLMSTLQG